MAEDKILAEARARIDAIDDQLLDLLNQRAALAHQVVIGKQAEADSEVIYYRPEREAEVMRRLLAANRGPFSNQTIQAVFREVISATLALEHPLAVAVSGQLGGVGEHAAACHFGRSVEVQNYSSLAAALDSVGRQSELALLAIDDARGSLFPEQLALLCESDLLPVAELVVMGKYGVVQCGNPAPDQAIEVKAPVDDEKGSPPLSVQSVPSAEFQQLLSHAEGDHRVMVNLDRDLVGWRGDCRYSEISMPVKTRFLVLGRQRCVSTGQDRTLFCGNDRAAVMQMVQTEEAARRTSQLARVGDRDGFALIIDGHSDDPAVQELFSSILTVDTSTRIVGSWPVVTRHLFPA